MKRFLLIPLIFLAIIGAVRVFHITKNTLEQENNANISTEAEPTTQVEEDVKQVTSRCLDNVILMAEDSKTALNNMSNQEAVFTINTKYRLCLADNGLTPQDLLSLPSSSAQEAIRNNSSNSMLEDQVNRQQADIKKIKEEEQNRQFWEQICSVRNQTYNSVVGAGCK
jgi:hypothetical protein